MKNRLSAILTIAFATTTLAAPAFLRAQAVPATPPAPAAQDKPAAPPATPDKRINGKWKFIFDTSGGDREFNAEFTVDADGNVTGTWEKAPASGTYKDGHLLLAFDFTSDEANETAPLHIDGKLDDSEAISGTWQFSSYDGTFKATHPKP